MSTAVERIVVQATAQDKKAIVANAKRLDMPVAELMRRGAFAHESDVADDGLATLAEASRHAADRAGLASTHRQQAHAHAGPEGGLIGVTDKVWGALSWMIKLEDKVNRQADAMKSQQVRIEDLTGRVIRLQAQLELLTDTALIRCLTGGSKGPGG